MDNRLKKVLASCLISSLVLNGSGLSSSVSANEVVNGGGVVSGGAIVVETPIPSEVPTPSPVPTATWDPFRPPVFTAEPEVTEVPTPTRDPFFLGVEGTEVPEVTEDPSLITPAPTFELKRPETEYYNYYDRMEWEKENINKNITKIDEKNGAVKELNAKIPKRYVKYQKGKKQVTIKAKYGDCFRLCLKGVKKYKKVNPSGAGPRADLEHWDKVTSTKDGKNYRFVSISWNHPVIYGFRVNGKLFKVKIVPYGKKQVKSSKEYEKMSEYSKYTWKSKMPNITTYDMWIHSIGYDSLANSVSNGKGRSRYCRWNEDSLYIQGYEISREHISNGIEWGRVAALIDYSIEKYHIPSAEKMTKEQCCKWIRRNGRILRGIYNIHIDSKISYWEGNQNTGLSWALYPIFDKAYGYGLSDKWTANSLMFYHIYKEELPRMKYSYYQYNTWSTDIGYQVGEGYDRFWIHVWGMDTWVGRIYESLQVSIFKRVYSSVKL